MPQSLVEQIADAVLYEGYILYPYRASSTKNRQRFTFGRVYPEAYSRAQRGAEPCTMQTQCLIQQTEREAPLLDVRVRFLHPMAREVGRLPAPLPELPDGAEPAFQVIPEMRVGDRIYQTWQEAVERVVHPPPLDLPAPARRIEPISFDVPAVRTLEPIRDEEDQVIGVLLRRQHALEGAVEIRAEPLEESLFRITVQIRNHTPIPEGALDDQDAVLLRTFASTHTILHVQDGAFVSLLDPPPGYARAAAACENTGTWPVLVGEDGARDTMLSSPIILYDYPEVAPESPGALFDGTEIDEILTLRIMTMTEEEKLEMRQVDDHARQILQRTEGLSQDHMMNMHGTIRTLRPMQAPDTDR